MNETMPSMIHRFGNSFINYRNSPVESLPQHTLFSWCHTGRRRLRRILTEHADICRQAYMHNYSILSAFHLSLGPYYYYTSCALFLPCPTSLSCPVARPVNLSVSPRFLWVIHSDDGHAELIRVRIDIHKTIIITVIYAFDPCKEEERLVDTWRWIPDWMLLPLLL